MEPLYPLPGGLIRTVTMITRSGVFTCVRAGNGLLVVPATGIGAGSRSPRSVAVSDVMVMSMSSGEFTAQVQRDGAVHSYRVALPTRLLDELSLPVEDAHRVVGASIEELLDGDREVPTVVDLELWWASDQQFRSALAARLFGAGGHRRRPVPLAARGRSRFRIVPAPPSAQRQSGGFGIGFAASAAATATRFEAIARPVLADQSCLWSVSVYDGPGPGPMFQYVQAWPGIGEADVDERAGDLADDVVGAVLVAGDDDAGDPVVGDRAPSSSVSEIIASIRSSTRWATLDGRPSQVGVATTRISPASEPLVEAGHASPSPSSDVTPGRMSWSTTRMRSTPTSPSSGRRRPRRRGRRCSTARATA